jgi:hypothetical protein
VRHSLPQSFKRLPRATYSACTVASGKRDSIHGTGGCCCDGPDIEAILFQQPVEDAPSVGAMGTAALQGETQRLLRRFRHSSLLFATVLGC